jgi:manganese transport protein
MTNDRALMGKFVNRLPTRLLAWLLFAVITAANLWLVWQTFGGS